MGDFKNKWFERNMRWQLHSLIEYYLYPEFRDKKKIKPIIHANRYLIFFISVFLLTSIGAFIFGKKIQEGLILDLNNKIEYYTSLRSEMLKEISKKDSTISEMNKHLKSRKYIEYQIITECKITSIDNLKELPDSIFFLMVNESEKNGIPYMIYFRLIERESGFKFIANTEGSGAMGYMQIMPSTFKSYANILNLKGGHTPENNIKIGSYFLGKIFKIWNQKYKDEKTAWEYALCEYGCGKGSMQLYSQDSTVVGYFIPNSLKPGIEKVMRYYEPGK